MFDIQRFPSLIAAGYGTKKGALKGWETRRKNAHARASKKSAPVPIISVKPSHALVPREPEYYSEHEPYEEPPREPSTLDFCIGFLDELWENMDRMTKEEGEEAIKAAIRYLQRRRY